MTAADLKEYVEAHDSESTHVAAAWATATALVDAYVGAAEVPEGVRFAAYLEVGAAIYRRKSAPGGATQFAVLGEQNVARISADPLAGVYALFRPWMGPVIA